MPTELSWPTLSGWRRVCQQITNIQNSEHVATAIIFLVRLCQMLFWISLRWLRARVAVSSPSGQRLTQYFAVSHRHLMRCWVGTTSTERSPFWEADSSCCYSGLPHFVERGVSLSRSQEPVICPYPEPGQCSPRLPILFTYLRSTLILPFLLRLGLSNCLFHLGIPAKTPYAFFLLSCPPPPPTCLLRPFHSSWFGDPSNVWWALPSINVFFFTVRSFWSVPQPPRWRSPLVGCRLSWVIIVK
jgi:hypothetical protein